LLSSQRAVAKNWMTLAPNVRRLGPPPKRDLSRSFQTARGRRSRARRWLAGVTPTAGHCCPFVNPTFLWGGNSPRIRTALFAEEIARCILKQCLHRGFKFDRPRRTFKPASTPGEITCPTNKLNQRDRIKAERSGGLLGKEQVPSTIEA